MKVAWLFPGQGSQVVGMGRDVAAASPAARDVYQRVDAALEGALGRALSSICFEGPEQDLTLTAITQPAIVATSIALLAALRERHPSLPPPQVAAGHSLGEYAALVAAGALGVAEACRVVHRRGRAMQDALPPGEGAMSAVLGMDTQALEELCRDVAKETGGVVSAANYNAPGQTVIAGDARAVALANERIAARRGKAIPLRVSSAFHCERMRPAEAVVRAALDEIEVRPPRFAVIANVDAAPKHDPESVRDALVRQVTAPVRWQATIERMAADGVTHALEIGPGKVLQGLVKRTAKDVKVLSVSDAASIDAVGSFLASSEGT